MMTIDEYLAGMEDGQLVDIAEEILTGVVPSTGAAQTTRRHINTLVNKGELCINPTSYRLLFLPTLTKLVFRELAIRFCRNLETGR